MWKIDEAHREGTKPNDAYLPCSDCACIFWYRLHWFCNSLPPQGDVASEAPWSAWRSPAVCRMGTSRRAAGKEAVLSRWHREPRHAGGVRPAVQRRHSRGSWSVRVDLTNVVPIRGLRSALRISGANSLCFDLHQWHREATWFFSPQLCDSTWAGESGRWHLGGTTPVAWTVLGCWCGGGQTHGTLFFNTPVDWTQIVQLAQLDWWLPFRFHCSSFLSFPFTPCLPCWCDVSMPPGVRSEKYLTSS